MLDFKPDRSNPYTATTPGPARAVGLQVEEHDSVVDRLARDVEVVRGEILNGIANGETAQNLIVGRNVELRRHRARCRDFRKVALPVRVSALRIRG